MNIFFKQSEKLIEKAYNLSAIFRQHCKTNAENLKEVANISTLTDCLHSYIDKLYNLRINFTLE